MDDRKLLSEAATARYANVALTTLRRARQAGKVSPVEEMLTGMGTVRLYDAEAVRKFFAEDQEYQANLVRAKGGKVESALNPLVAAINRAAAVTA